MSTRKTIVFLVIALILLGLALYFFPQVSVRPQAGSLSDAQKTSVEKYVRENISTLSPEPEVLGGTFYVTGITFYNENTPGLEAGQYVGRVEYEDGHNAFTGQFIFLFNSEDQPEIVSFDIVTDEHENVSFREYSSTTLGLAFKYPSHYFLEEKNTGTPQRGRTTIILTEDTEENRLVREGKSPGREGPVAITIDIHQNNLDNLSAEAWIRGSNDSNFKLSNGLLTSVMLGGYPAIQYVWSGLYEADNVVSAANGNLYSLSVTYIAPNDQIRNDFRELLKTVSLQPIDEVSQIQ